MEGKNIVVDWFGKPPSNPRGEGGVGLFVWECLVDEVDFVSTVKYEKCVDESSGEEGEGSIVYLLCVHAYGYIAVIEESYASLR